MSDTVLARAQVEPTAALVAVAAVVIAVGLYVTVLADAVPRPERDVAEPTLSAVRDRLTADLGGVADPSAVADAVAAGPEGVAVNATLEAAGHRVAVGPSPPAGADVAAEAIPVRLAPKTVRPGRLTVRVWR